MHMSHHINEVTFSSLISENLSTSIAITMFSPSVVTTTKILCHIQFDIR